MYSCVFWLCNNMKSDRDQSIRATKLSLNPRRGRGGGLLPYVGYIGVCRCEGYGFQAVYSRTGYINQRVWV